MAERALKKLEDQLNCAICLDTYTDPKQLQCNHVYCQQCLVRLVFRDQQGQTILTCPNCRQVTPVPASGVAGLQVAFQINQLLEIVGEHKKAKDATASEERIQSASTSPTAHKSTTVGCSEHGGREVELYCETCEETICFKCIKKDEKHHSHNYEELDEAFERYKKEVMSSLEPMEKQLVTIERALAQLDTRCEEISNQQATIEANIHDTFTRLHQTLDIRKTELIDQLHRLTHDKLKSLAVQRDQIETTQAQLGNCIYFMRENLKTGNQGETLKMKSTTVRQMKDLATTFLHQLEPNTEADLTLSTSSDSTEVIQNYGQMHQKGSPDPSKCIATGKGTEVAVVGEKSAIIHLHTLSIDSVPSEEDLDSITCELVSEMTGTRVGGSVERRGQSQYEISYQPTIKGRHQLHIKLEGQHIRGSPFPVTARTQLQILNPITAIVEVKRPRGVAVNHRGEVIVVGGCISVFSPRKEKLRTIGTQGFGRGHFQDPRGVAVDGEGYILVTDRDNHCIQKLTAEGRFITAVGTEGSKPLQFNSPCGIAYNSRNGKVYVVDKTCRIQILNSDLSYADSFGEAGGGKGWLDNPQHLVCNSKGNVYVADCDNHRIQAFTAEGKFLRMFGTCGDCPGALWGPNGLAIDSSDRVYVSEFNNHRVSVFTSEGQFVTSFGERGSGSGQFYGPTGLAVDSCKVVYVCDYRNHRVQVF